MSTSAGRADIDTAIAATTARTMEKRIVCAGVIGDQIDLKGGVRRSLALYAEYWKIRSAMPPVPAPCKPTSTGYLVGNIGHHVE